VRAQNTTPAARPAANSRTGESKKANIWNWMRYTCSDAAARTSVGRTRIFGSGTVATTASRTSPNAMTRLRTGSWKNPMVTIIADAAVITRRGQVSA